jgi:hypothetical protein
MSPPGALMRAEASLEAGNSASSDGLIAALQAQNTARQVFIAELQTRIAGVGAPARVEQQQQRQAAVERRAEKAATGQQPPGTGGQKDRRAEGSSG